MARTTFPQTNHKQRTLYIKGRAFFLVKNEHMFSFGCVRNCEFFRYTVDFYKKLDIMKVHKNSYVLQGKVFSGR